MSLRLDQIDKLSPKMRAQALADQARATAARERIMAQAKYDGQGRPARTTPYGPNGEELQAQGPSPAPAAKSPRNPVSGAMPWLPAKQLHAIPDPNYGPSSSPQPESAVRDESLATPQGETLYSGRVHVRITSYRRRLLDPDNLTAKWFLDACRYSRLIRDDNPEAITYQVGQEKVARKEDERTEIVIEPIPDGTII